MVHAGHPAAPVNCIGFAPSARADARALILGTLPGRVSLLRGEYYAHPRNAFWPIMGDIFGSSDWPYSERLARLNDNAIALWDVCARGDRAGSLDAAIDIATAIPNDFAAFFDRHPSIELICFNGGKANTLFERRVLPTLPLSAQRASRVMLPSTSPAHAAMTFGQKLERWRAAIEAFVASEQRAG